jgi:hypothetical protein
VYSESAGNENVWRKKTIMSEIILDGSSQRMYNAAKEGSVIVM